jgi:hypothetical protein
MCHGTMPSPSRRTRREGGREVLGGHFTCRIAGEGEATAGELKGRETKAWELTIDVQLSQAHGSWLHFESKQALCSAAKKPKTWSGL